MRFLLLIMILSLDFSVSLANVKESKKIEKVINNYLTALKTKDRKKLKQVVTDKYYQELDKEDGLTKLFAKQENDGKKITVDIKVIKQKSGHRANIKNKSDTEYDHYWYKVVSEKGDFKLDGTFHLEE